MATPAAVEPRRRRAGTAEQFLRLREARVSSSNSLAVQAEQAVQAVRTGIPMTRAPLYLNHPTQGAAYQRPDHYPGDVLAARSPPPGHRGGRRQHDQYATTETTTASRSPATTVAIA